MSEYEEIKTIVCASDWLDQSRSGDSMKGRIVLLKWNDPKTGEIIKFSTHEQWEDSRKENWENPKKPNFAYGHYFNGYKTINDEIQQDYYQRAVKMLSWYKPAPKLTVIDLTVDNPDFKSKEMDMGAFHNFLANKLGEE